MSKNHPLGFLAATGLSWVILFSPIRVEANPLSKFCRSVLQALNHPFDTSNSIADFTLRFDEFEDAREKNDVNKGASAFLGLLKYQSQFKMSARLSSALRRLLKMERTRYPKLKFAKQGFVSLAWAIGPFFYPFLRGLIQMPSFFQWRKIKKLAFSVGRNSKALAEIPIEKDDFLKRVLREISKGDKYSPPLTKEFFNWVGRTFSPLALGVILSTVAVHPIYLYLALTHGETAYSSLAFVQGLSKIDPRFNAVGKNVGFVITEDTFTSNMDRIPSLSLLYDFDTRRDLGDSIYLNILSDSFQIFYPTNFQSWTNSLKEVGNRDIVYILDHGRPGAISFLSTDEFDSNEMPKLISPQTEVIYISCLYGNCLKTQLNIEGHYSFENLSQWMSGGSTHTIHAASTGILRGNVFFNYRPDKLGDKLKAKWIDIISNMGGSVFSFGTGKAQVLILLSDLFDSFLGLKYPFVGLRVFDPENNVIRFYEVKEKPGASEIRDQLENLFQNRTEAERENLPDKLRRKTQLLLNDHRNLIDIIHRPEFDENIEAAK